jgi:hypothetical protein
LDIPWYSKKVYCRLLYIPLRHIKYDLHRWDKGRKSPWFDGVGSVLFFFFPSVFVGSWAGVFVVCEACSTASLSNKWYLAWNGRVYLMTIGSKYQKHHVQRIYTCVSR